MKNLKLEIRLPLHCFISLGFYQKNAGLCTFNYFRQTKAAKRRYL